MTHLQRLDKSIPIVNDLEAIKKAKMEAHSNEKKIDFPYSDDANGKEQNCLDHYTVNSSEVFVYNTREHYSNQMGYVPYNTITEVLELNSQPFFTQKDSEQQSLVLPSTTLLLNQENTQQTMYPHSLCQTISPASELGVMSSYIQSSHVTIFEGNSIQTK